MKDKLFRDPVHDYITIKKEDYWLVDLINSPELQRLRFISQLGLCHYTYPGTTHSRFSHSLGVLHLMQSCVDRLHSKHKEYFEPFDKKILLASALLHDIGHSPLSHATEDVFGNHEQRSIKLILDKSTTVNQVLSEIDSSVPQKVASVISDSPIEDVDTATWQKSLISSQLDMDRLDYLKRDSFFSGAGYGHYDIYRIIHTMDLKVIQRTNGEDIFLVWPDKTKYALEEYIFSRYYMYANVYFHHTTRGLEKLLDAILRRARYLLSSDPSFANSMNKKLAVVIKDEKQEDYEFFLSVNDAHVLAQIGDWQDHSDNILSDLSKRLVRRQVFGYGVIAGTRMEAHNKIAAIEDCLSKCGLDPAYYFYEDSTSSKHYQPYRPEEKSEEQSSATSIMLDYNANGNERKSICEISAYPGLDRIRAIALTGQQSVDRYYFPKECESDIRKILS